MKITLFFYLQGSLRATPESAGPDAEARLGQLKRSDMTLSKGQDPICYPYSSLETVTESPRQIQQLCEHYIPLHIHAGGYVFILGQVTLQIWNGRSTEITIDEQTGKGLRKGSRAQLVLEVDDLDVEDMASIMTVFKANDPIDPKGTRKGNALIWRFYTPRSLLN